MDSFVEYLYYLFPSALKQIDKRDNTWMAFCKVFGRRLDRLKTLILDVREMSAILTCPAELLTVFGQERDMPRLAVESEENYRLRLAMKCEIAKRAGTTGGVIAAVRAFGYEGIRVEPVYLTEPERWAEATIWVENESMRLLNRPAVLAAVNEAKPASALLTLSNERNAEASLYFGAVMKNGGIVDLKEV